MIVSPFCRASAASSFVAKCWWTVTSFFSTSHLSSQRTSDCLRPPLCPFFAPSSHSSVDRSITPEAATTLLVIVLPTPSIFVPFESNPPVSFNDCLDLLKPQPLSVVTPTPFSVSSFPLLPTLSLVVAAITYCHLSITFLVEVFVHGLKRLSG